MDAPGFPEGPDSPTVKLLLWGLLAIMVVVSIVVTVFAARRRRNPGFVVGIGVGSLTLAIIAYFSYCYPPTSSTRRLVAAGAPSMRWT